MRTFPKGGCSRWALLFKIQLLFLKKKKKMHKRISGGTVSRINSSRVHHTFVETRDPGQRQVPTWDSVHVCPGSSRGRCTPHSLQPAGERGGEAVGEVGCGWLETSGNWTSREGGGTAQGRLPARGGPEAHHTAGQHEAQLHRHSSPGLALPRWPESPRRCSSSPGKART